LLFFLIFLGGRHLGRPASLFFSIRHNSSPQPPIIQVRWPHRRTQKLTIYQLVIIMDDDPLRPDEAKQLILAILERGELRTSSHARDELNKDGMDLADVRNVLRGGNVREPEREHGSWRYRVETPRFCIVLAFRDTECMVVVTAWRFKR
jgi:hypothetical protein